MIIHKHVHLHIISFCYCIYKFWISSSDISVNFWYIFGKFAIVYTVMEKCTWICTYLQYRHVSFYDHNA